MPGRGHCSIGTQPEVDAERNRLGGMNYQPLKLTQPLKSMVGRWYFLFGWPIFRGYVSFLEGRSSEVLRHMQSSMELEIYFCKSLWWTYTVNVGKYTIHGSYWYLLGIANTPLFYDFVESNSASLWAWNGRSHICDSVISMIRTQRLNDPFDISEIQCSLYKLNV